MTRKALLVAGVGGVIFTVAGLTFARMAYVERYGSAEIDYRGEKSSWPGNTSTTTTTRTIPTISLRRKSRGLKT
jgi:hypothetical protein